MNANVRVVVEVTARLAALVAFLAVLPYAFMFWLQILWLGAFTGGTSEAVLVMVFVAGIFGFVLFPFAIWWADSRIVKGFDRLDERLWASADVR